MSEVVATDPRERQGTSTPWLMLGLATLGFAVNFWAWALISPLGPMFRDSGTLGDLTESDVALLVAVPVLVGSLGRIIVGALTDRFGGRVMFPVISAVTILPILFIAFVALDSYALLLVGGFFLGIAGTAFAVGVPFVNAWFPPERRGLAIGIFGAGMGGTAISALTTVKLFTNVGETSPFLITSAVLAAYAVLAWMRAARRAGPGRPDHQPGHPAEGQRPAPDHLAGVHPLRGRVRWVRRVLGLPAGLPQGRARPHAGRCRQPDGRLRRRGRDHATGRRLALRQVRADPGPVVRVRGRGRSLPRSRPARRPSTASARSPSSPWPRRWAAAAVPRSP